MSSKFSHLTPSGKPNVVDVSLKENTERIATARALVALPREILDKWDSEELVISKGPIIHTAVLAGIMGAKQTSSIIPLCHPLPINGCNIDISLMGDNQLEIICTVKTFGKTGVEMEALTGASIAALTVYDMCKGFSHEIVIQEVKLIHKSGGKSEYHAQ